MLPLLSLDIAETALKKLAEAYQELRTGKARELDAIADVFGNPDHIASIYIEPELQHYNPADWNEDIDGCLLRQPAFHLLRERFFPGFRKGGEGNQLLLLADAGMGKTSLLVMLKLMHLASFWPQSYDCVLMKLETDSITRIEAIPRKHATVLLLDALDEDPSAWERAMQRLEEILAATESFHRVIVTCRTQFFEAQSDPIRQAFAVVSGYRCPVLYLSLFDDIRVANYLAGRFATDPEQIDKVRRAWNILNKAGSLKFRPLLLAYIEELLYVEMEEQAWSEYTIYESLVAAWLTREQRKMVAARARRPPTAGALALACEAIAVRAQATRLKDFSDEELSEWVAVCPEIEHLSMLHIGGRSLINKNSWGKFRFAHYSIQEFLVAKSVVEGRITRFAPRSDDNLRVTDQMLRFLNSWLSRNSSITARERLRMGPLALAGVDLSSVDFCHVSLTSASLSHARLQGAKLRFSILERADLRDADLRGADFEGALLSAAHLDRALMSGARLCSSQAAAMHATRARLDAIEVSDSHCDSSTFSESDLSRAVFKAVVLRDAVFRCAILREACFRNCDLQGASFEEAILFGADFSEAGNLSHTKFSRSLADETTRWPGGAPPEGVYQITPNAYLQGAVLRGRNLAGRVLDGADLRGADFTGADLSGTSLRGADLRGAVFIDASISNMMVSGAHVDSESKWPLLPGGDGVKPRETFNPIKYGAIFMG